MTPAEKLAALQRWQAAIERSDALIDPVIMALGLSPESAVSNAVWGLQSAFTREVGAIVGDTGDWLNWHVHENDMGKRGFSAGPGEDLRPIRTLADLLWLIDVAA